VLHQSPLTLDFNYRLGSMSGSNVFRNSARSRRHANAARGLHADRGLHKTRRARFPLLRGSVAHFAQAQHTALPSEKLGRILHYVAACSGLRETHLCVSFLYQ
jgi:hypothetical protein